MCSYNGQMIIPHKLFFEPQGWIFKSLLWIYENYSKWKGFLPIFVVRSYHMSVFENENFWDLYENYGINHNYSTFRIPQQNSNIERNIHVLQEMT